LTINQTGGGVTIVQDLSLKSGAVDEVFMWLVGGKKDIEKMNQRGLELLKITVEKNSHQKPILSLVG